ncbi:uncharacterized protein LOC142350733 isoform X2 [Convolutriloba macropyga]|uniref:uncharacterized protein LOC142350733 isoform X2 n=1 Tax=Convolutriloba macropyga TaxID=536237 RepID=UPI003F51F8E5
MEILVRVLHPILFVPFILYTVRCGSDSGEPFMCDSPQKGISCLVDPYFQYHCKEACKHSHRLQEEVGYPELFSLPALVVLSAASVDESSGQVCRDIAPYCPLITVNIGGYFRCTTSAIVQTQCPESCGLCPKSNAGSSPEAAGSGAPGSTNLIRAMPYADVPISPTCGDHMPICFTVYAQYACLNDPHFRQQCPQTCGICQPPTTSALVQAGCSDLSASSCQWIPNSMCAFQGVQIQCAAKCGLCPGPQSNELTDLELILEDEFLAGGEEDYNVDNETTTAAGSSTIETTTIETTTEAPNGECEDLLPPFLCKAFWAKFACTDNTSDFRVKCKKSCGFCPKDLVTTTETGPVTEPANDCKDLYPSFMCQAFWAKFACANKASGFSRKCRKSCNQCPGSHHWPLPLVQQGLPQASAAEDDMPEDLDSMNSYSLKSADLQKLEALLAHYYLKLEQVPDEMFDYESPEVCNSDYMKKFGCVYDVVSSVFCKETCLGVINNLVAHPGNLNLMLKDSSGAGLHQQGEAMKQIQTATELEQPTYRVKMTNRATVVGAALGIVAMVALIAGLAFRIIANRHSRRFYSQI